MRRTFFPNDLRDLDEILATEKETFDKVRYERLLRHDRDLLAAGKHEELAEHERVAGPGREGVEKAYGTENLSPFDAFDLGMLNGKLSALRWVLRDQWDFLGTWTTHLRLGLRTHDQLGAVGERPDLVYEQQLGSRTAQGAPSASRCGRW